MYMYMLIGYSQNISLETIDRLFRLSPGFCSHMLTNNSHSYNWLDGGL